MKKLKTALIIFVILAAMGAGLGGKDEAENIKETKEYLIQHSENIENLKSEWAKKGVEVNTDTLKSTIFIDFAFGEVPTKGVAANARNNALYDVFQHEGFEKLIVRIGEKDGPSNKYGTFRYENGEWDKDI